MFSRKWLFTTLLVLAGVAVLARLGFWQLERLAQRKAFNERVLAQIDQPVFELAGEGLSADLYNMEYRQATVTGVYDFSSQVALKNQSLGAEYGVHLLTPLQITDSDMAVLVDRGFIPGADAAPSSWAKYDQPGEVTVIGAIRRPQEKADFGRLADPLPAAGEPPLMAWNLINVAAIAGQIHYPLLNIYIQQAPNGATGSGPVSSAVELDLSEGSHLSYALQWFSFAALLGMGYPFYLRREMKRLAAPNHPKNRDLVTNGE